MTQARRRGIRILNAVDQPSFWVVETALTTYWDGRKTGHEASFFGDISEAIKFYSFEDAERARCWLLEPPALTLRSVEHMFVEPTTKQSAA